MPMSAVANRRIYLDSTRSTCRFSSSTALAVMVGDGEEVATGSASDCYPKCRAAAWQDLVHVARHLSRTHRHKNSISSSTFSRRIRNSATATAKQRLRVRLQNHQCFFLADPQSIFREPASLCTMLLLTQSLTRGKICNRLKIGQMDVSRDRHPLSEDRVCSSQYTGVRDKRSVRI